MLKKFVLFSALCVAGCSTNIATKPFMKEGANLPTPQVIQIARVVTAKSEPSTIYKVASISSRPELAFSGLPFKRASYRQPVVISLGNKTITYGGETHRYNGELSNGSSTLIQKTADPVWYAPDEYFVNRRLPIPGEASPDRFLKGYGEYGIFLDNGSSIHCNPLSEVGGISMDCDALKILASKLKDGDNVIVK